MLPKFYIKDLKYFDNGKKNKRKTIGIFEKDYSVNLNRLTYTENSKNNQLLCKHLFCKQFDILL